MKLHHSRGSASLIGLLVVGILIVGGAVFLLAPAEEGTKNVEQVNEGTAMEKDGDTTQPQDGVGAMVDSIDRAEEAKEVMEKGLGGLETSDAMEQKDTNVAEAVTSMPQETPTAPSMPVTYVGQRLAGDSAPLLAFNQTDYEKALAEGKEVALFFYAEWCPNCKKEFPRMEAAFDKLESDDVVGFRVNFKDSDTDKDEEALARKYGVAYQHTKVFLKDGERVLKSPETWTESRYDSELATLIN